MSEFQLLDTKSYPLIVDEKTDDLVYHRFEHRATIGYNCREFMVFVDHVRGQSHIEEITGGHLERIEDESLHSSLSNFAVEKNLLSLGLPPLRKLA